jgi:hypothetical protein
MGNDKRWSRLKGQMKAEQVHPERAETPAPPPARRAPGKGAAPTGPMPVIPEPASREQPGGTPGKPQ